MTIQNIGVVGAGTMGSGITQICALNGLSIVMQDETDELLEAGLKAIERCLNRLDARKTITG